MLITTMADNGTLHNPMLYRSYADAKKTDFECMLYECENAEDIPGYIERLIERVTLECYYRPGNEEHVYIETGDWEQIRAEFIGMIFIQSNLDIKTTFGLLPKWSL